jgi:hypothetical protein
MQTLKKFFWWYWDLNSGSHTVRQVLDHLSNSSSPSYHSFNQGRESPPSLLQSLAIPISLGWFLHSHLVRAEEPYPSQSGHPYYGLLARR